MNKTRFSFLKAPVALVLAVMIAGMPSTADASLAGARYNAAVLFNKLRINGWAVRDCFDVGLLKKGQSVLIRTTLLAGNTYKIASAGCEDGFDVDIAVFDENGNFVSGDRDTSQLAVADVRPAWSGTFFIKVTMHNSTWNGAHYVVQYAYN